MSREAWSISLMICKSPSGTTLTICKIQYLVRFGPIHVLWSMVYISDNLEKSIWHNSLTDCKIKYLLRFGQIHVSWGMVHISDDLEKSISWHNFLTNCKIEYLVRFGQIYVSWGMVTLWRVQIHLHAQYFWQFRKVQPMAQLLISCKSTLETIGNSPK